MPIDYRRKMEYYHFTQLNIESLIKALSMWKRASKVFLIAGRGPALPALRKILTLLWAINQSVTVANVQNIWSRNRSGPTGRFCFVSLICIVHSCGQQVKRLSGMLIKS